MMPASILAKMQGRDQIDVKDIDECWDLFLDPRRSARIVRERGVFVQAKATTNNRISLLPSPHGALLFII